MADHNEYYREEALELLESIEQNLIELESNPEDYETLNAIFRAFHTIKGSGSMFGYTDVVQFTHELETMFDYLRDGKLTADKTIIDISLHAKDHIHGLIFDPEAVEAQAGQSILSRIAKMYKEHGITSVLDSHEVQEEQELKAPEPDALPERTYRIIIKPGEDFFRRGARIEPIIKDLEDFGVMIVFAHHDKVPTLADIEPELNYLYWTILLTTTRSEADILTCFIFIEDYSDISLSVIDDSSQFDVSGNHKRIGEILTETGCIDEEDIENIMHEQPKLGELGVKKGLISERDIDIALNEQKYVRKLRKQRTESMERSTIRVKSEKLDSLVNLVGEMVTLQARLSRLVEISRGDGTHHNSEMDNVAESMSRLTAELRDNAMEIRMVTFTEVFNSFQRLVRDLSGDLNKQVKLETRGSETELDKNIIDALKDPLVHIIRNAVDHGIESPEDRVAKGKDAAGSLLISAENHSTHVLLSIQDDGKGLDSAQIHKKALEKGLISDTDRLSDKEIFNLIFVPGFSTAAVTTNVSGRGVGMDVVKRNIEQLRGSIEVNSSKGRGTRIELTIPLTLSIIDGLLIRLGDEHYIINLQAVDECFELKPDSFEKGEGNKYLRNREKVLPFMDLRDFLEIDRDEEAISEVVTVRNGDSQIALIVDEIIGQHQTVIKPLNHAMSNVREISGSSILGDGTIAFILDVNKISEGATGARAVQL